MGAEFAVRNARYEGRSLAEAVWSGVFATFSTNAGNSRVEMGWGSEAIWTLRGGDERVLDARLAREILEGGSLTIRTGGQFMSHRQLTWTMSGFGRDLVRIRRLCAG